MYLVVVGDDTDSGAVQADGHCGDETADVLPNVVEVALLDGRRRVKYEVEVDSEIVWAAVPLAALGDVALPLAVSADALWIVGNANFEVGWAGEGAERFLIGAIGARGLHGRGDVPGGGAAGVVLVVVLRLVVWWAVVGNVD